MLVRRDALAASGGLAGIAGARIDDVALARLLKRGRARARCWLGFTTQVRSVRPYPGLAALWDMVARSAYTQLRYSPLLLAATVAGLLWLYLLPPVTGLAGLAALAAGGPATGWTGAPVQSTGGSDLGWVAATGLAGWAIMTATYLPVLRLYRLSWLRAPVLPLIALLYAGMTVDSARRHHLGRGGEWKGRLIPAPTEGAPTQREAGQGAAAQPGATRRGAIQRESGQRGLDQDGLGQGKLGQGGLGQGGAGPAGPPSPG